MSFFKNSRACVALFLVCLFAFPVQAWATVYGYVINSGDRTLSVIDLNTNDVFDTISIPDTSTPMTMSVNGTGAYIVNNGSNTVTLLNLQSNTFVQNISINQAPQSGVISGTGFYIATTQDNVVSVIDTRTNTQVKTISVGNTPFNIAAGGTGVYVSNSDSNTVSVIDTTTNTVERTIAVGNYPNGLAVSGTGVFVANYSAGTVSVIDTTSLTVEKTITVGSGPYDIAISGTGAFVANSNATTVSMIDTTTSTVEKTISLGASPFWIAARNSRVYVSHLNDDIVSVINATSLTAIDTITVGNEPRGIAFGPDLSVPSVSFDASASTQNEEIGTVRINVAVSGAVPFDISLPYTISATASNGTDYTIKTPSPLIIENGETSTGILLTILNDTEIEGNELITLTLGTPTNATLGATTSHTVTIVSDDAGSSSSVGNGGGNGGVRAVTLEMKQKALNERFGGSSASSSTPSKQAATGTAFTDVPSSAWFAQYIEALRSKGIISGYKDRAGNDTHTFGPGDQTSYGQLAKMMLLLLKRQPAGTAATMHWAEPYVRQGRSIGLSVYLNEKLNLDTPATRGAVVRTVLEAYGISLDALPQNTFKDLPAKHPYAKDMLTAVSLGILSGDANTKTARPDAPINRAEIAKLLVEVSQKFTPKAPVARSSSSSSTSRSASASSSAAPKLVGNIRTVATPTLNVRSDARINASILWTARQGQQMEVLRIVHDDWAQVRMADGSEGFVWVQHLK